MQLIVELKVNIEDKDDRMVCTCYIPEHADKGQYQKWGKGKENIWTVG